MTARLAQCTLTEQCLHCPIADDALLQLCCNFGVLLLLRTACCWDQHLQLKRVMYVRQ